MKALVFHGIVLGVVVAFLAACSGGGGKAAQTQTQTEAAGTKAEAAQTQTEAAATQTEAAGASSVQSGAASLQEQYVEIVQKVTPSVVQIQTSEGLGSGIVFDANGDIVTNNHVVGSSTTFQVTLVNGERYEGTLVGTFPPNDIAVIRIKASNLQPAVFADSSALAVGDIVLAVGNPLGLQSSVTEGIISALGRTLSEQNGYTLPALIQTSASINPGNSGGALVDLEAEVVGIPTLGTSEASGIGFAIPSNTVKDLASQIVQYGHVVSSGRAYLGVELTTISSGQGVLVQSVTPGGPADQAGIKTGDLITAIGGTPTPSVEAVAAALAAHKPGETVKVDLTHADGTKASVDVTLGQYPGQ